MNLHSNEEEVIPKVYTQDETMRYITFAKQFQPVLTPDAVELLVKCYTNLRQKDNFGKFQDWSKLMFSLSYGIFVFCENFEIYYQSVFVTLINMEV